MPAPDVIVVDGPDGAIPVSVRINGRCRRMTLRFSHSRNTLVLTLPDGTSPEAGRHFLERQAGWMRERLKAREAQVPFADGAMVPLRGVPHKIVHRSLRLGVTMDAKGGQGEPIIAVHGNVAGVARRVRSFMVAQAKADLSVAVAAHAATLGVRVRRVSIKDTHSRWGSCTGAGDLSFSWRLVMAPSFVLDYLAAHEVAHLRVMDHSARYWAVARRLCPRLDEAESWLKASGKTLHVYG